MQENVSRLGGLYGDCAPSTTPMNIFQEGEIVEAENESYDTQVITLTIPNAKNDNVTKQPKTNVTKCSKMSTFLNLVTMFLFSNTTLHGC